MIRKLVDTLNLEVSSGTGGSGIVSFRKLRTKKRSIPDGGNGGWGGSVYLRGQASLDDLRHLKRSSLSASPGKNGRKGGKTGENGTPLIINVPLGTRVLDRASGHLLLEVTDSIRYLLIAGGKPGYGNAGSHRHTATQGEAGTQLSLTFDYRLAVDVGIVGFPNTGKSTLLSRISSARPQIDSYPLTTRSPQIGVCDLGAQLPDFFGKPLTLVEIPAITNGRTNGKKFLKHLLRCRLVIYCIDSSVAPLLQQFADLRRTLAAYDESLSHKTALIVVSKTDKQPSYPKYLTIDAGRIGVEQMPKTANCNALQKKIIQLLEHT